MDIVAGSAYLPERVADNNYFSQLTGRAPEWFERATGIARRRRAGPEENTNTMAIAAVALLQESSGLDLSDIDLVVGASYTPWDTVGTMAHAVQRHFGLAGAKAIYLSTACSSFINAMELAAAYIETGRCRRALIVAAEHNSLYADDRDEQAGHLWGDAATAMVVEAHVPGGAAALRVLDITSRGLADIGMGPGGVYLQPRSAGLVMPYGKDVFQHACREMETTARTMLGRHGLSIADIRLLVPHQANDRIITQIAGRLGVDDAQVARTIHELGNTGCASTAITLLRHQHLLTPGDVVMLVTFGGGYSTGCALLRCER
ncbi:3-oxoacyl-[acyl-carrier-protein] synthase 3 [Arenimonas soli]|uniref:3-oxoacyl-[acyl-carrier-protein] synthase 3 n=1 Tax=Arenimonas soli TaxID=2269504 RepID=A0ABQ1HMX0_9GAMM|nr:ketoacyl-ACP synthase III [Arenimonas soli]GGA81901.1 3-oxoacyl-[acyl-carrier-protein] synthase 3 [Arenimonas soli]